MYFVLVFDDFVLPFSGKSLENIDPRLKFVYSEIFSIVINTDFNDKPKLMTSEYNRKSRRSFLLPCNNISISYKTISVDTFKDVLRTTLPSDNSVEVEDVIIILINYNYVIYYLR